MNLPFNGRSRPEWVLVTPEIAAEWLKKNTHNQPLHQRRVEKYARDMRAGKWKETHQGIAFSPNMEALIDGQHRLSAIVLSGVSVWMLVLVGQSFDTQAVVDTGPGRRAHHAIQLGLGMQVDENHVAIARAMISPNGDAGSTYQEIADYIAVHNDAINFANNLFTRHVKRVTTAALKAVVARAWYTQDRDRLQEFATVVMSSIAHSECDVSAIRLRECVASKNKQELYGKCERSVRAFLDRQPIDKLYAASNELFLLPGESPRVIAAAKKSRRLSAA